VKGKVVLVHVTKACDWSGGIASYTLSIGVRLL
jgi:hypothetical protein